MNTSSNAFWPGWETTRLIGRGSFGAVYEIQRKLFEDDDEVEKAALKVISIPQNDSDIEELYNDGYDEESVTSTFHTHLKSIVAEYSLMRKMNGSSNIVNCDDVRYVQHDDGIGWDIYIKMELLTPLAKALPAAVSEEQVIKIAKDMCAALELCSKHNIVHRDIKPQNIFVSENGDYKLGDFGIAKTVEKTMGGTKTGTYKYMAPEVYSNRPYNSSADIYSLGLVLYWLLNERRMPFMPLPPEKLRAGMDEESRNRRFAGEKIPAPKNGSEELKRIVLKACAYDPKDRYQSAAEMLADLKEQRGGSALVVIPQQEKECQNELDDSIVETEATIGPGCDKTPVDPRLDEDETVGPNFNPVSVDETVDQEKTVGPVFVAEDKPEQPKKKKVWPVIAILSVLVIAVVLGSIFVFSRAVVVGATPSQTDLEKHLLDGYSVIGCYEVSTKLPIGIETEVEFEVGEIYNSHVVLVTEDEGELSHTSVVSEGKVTVHIEPKGVFLLQIKTEATEGIAWSAWSTELPEGVSLNTNAVQADIMYRARQKEFATSSGETMDGWELYDTFIPDAPYGEWSDWTETALIADENHEVEEQKQYRSREKEFTSSNSAQLDGWMQSGSDVQYAYSEWSGWTSNPVSKNSTTEVETRSICKYYYDLYIDGVYDSSSFVELSNSGVSVGGVLEESYVDDEHWVFYVTSVENVGEYYRYRTKTVSSATYYFYRWTDWSDWGAEPVTESNTVEVEERTLYRIRDIYGDVGYRFWKWSDWSDWTLEKPTEREDTGVESCVVYRFSSQNEPHEGNLSIDEGTTELELEDRSAEVDELISKADRLAAQYNYDEAIALLKELEADVHQSQKIEDKIAAYEEKKSQLTVFSDMLSIPHISVNVLIADPERAFADESLGEKYAKNFITVSEFEKILEQLYANDYILVSLEDMVRSNTESGMLEMGQLMLPAGKKPIMLTEAIVNYFEYMIDSDGDGFADAGGDGFASRLVVRNGEIEAEYVDALGNVHIGKFDFVPILEDFIERYPDFSYRGARATLAVTGYEGVFGYRVIPSYIDTLGQEYVDDQIAQAKELVQLLREKGYSIACNSYGNVDYRNQSAAEIQADIGRWEKEILPVLGDVDTMVFARRSGLDDYAGAQLNLLLDKGFRYFISEGTSVQNHMETSYFHQNKLTIRGEMLRYQPELFSSLFDADKVLSDLRKEE